MVINPLKAFLFVAGGSAAAAGTAYVSGALDPYLHAQPAQIAALPEPQPDPAATKGERLPQQAAPTKPADAAVPGTAAAPAAAETIVPAFDVVRVEPDGSVVLAGKAAPEVLVEALAGTDVVGGAKADASGDFAIILEKPLKPGDYQLALRATGPGAAAVASAETAVISIPETSNGEVLAMVEEPGKPTEVVTAPRPASEPKPEEAAKPAAPADAEAEAVKPAESPSQPAAPPAEMAAVDPKPAEPASPAAADPAVAVQAVEIEGRKIFVAGVAESKRIVRVYANEILLGEAKAAPNGRFLVEAERELPVGNYIIRADVLGDGGIQVIARAAVPFEREPGEAIAAVAPSAATSAETVPPAATAVEPTFPADPAEPGDAAASEPARPAGAADPSALGGTVLPKLGTETAATPPAVTGPKLESVKSAVIIRRGDTLWRISRRVYGRGIRYSTIYLANQDQITNPDRIWPGQVFSVPDKTREGEAADLTALGEQMTSRPGAAETE